MKLVISATGIVHVAKRKFLRTSGSMMEIAVDVAACSATRFRSNFGNNGGMNTIDGDASGVTCSRCKARLEKLAKLGRDGK